MALLVYVDDIIITGPDLTAITDKELSSYSIQVEGPGYLKILSWFGDSSFFVRHTINSTPLHVGI